jgi:hypothetical protein
VVNVVNIVNNIRIRLLVWQPVRPGPTVKTAIHAPAAACRLMCITAMKTQGHFDGAYLCLHGAMGVRDVAKPEAAQRHPDHREQMRLAFYGDVSAGDLRAGRHAL